MAKREKKLKVEISENVKSKLKEINTILRERGLEKHNISSLIDFVFLEANQKTFDTYLNDNTPEEFKLKLLLKDPTHRLKIDELLREAQFGANA